MKKIILITSIILIIFFLIVLFFNNIITGKIIESTIQKYSFTKAICNDSKFCQDYEIKCEGKKLISTNPLTGAVAQFSPDWKDPRTEEQIDRLCD